MLDRHDQFILDLVTGETPSEKLEVKRFLEAAEGAELPRNQKIVALERAAISEHEEGNMRHALSILDGIIATNPNYASAYNNRAQVCRALGSTAPYDIVSDLKRAIALASSDSCTRYSPWQATVLRNAYGQLGAFYLDCAKRQNDAAESWKLQQKACHMLSEAAKYGDETAGKASVALNPYAKLCGQIVSTLGSHDVEKARPNS